MDGHVGARATISDVALRAGVTKATVSKFLNLSSGHYVAAETRERIEAAIRELDFEPSAIARGLTRNRTMTIGFVAADIRNPFYPDLVAGVQRTVEPAGYTLVLGSSGSDAAREQAIVRSMIQRRVDGVILGSARMRAADIGALMRSGTRFVLASRNLPEAITDSVVVDNRAGAELAVEHLAGLGHKRIGHIAGPQDVVPFRDRLAGFKSGLRRHGLKVDQSMIVTAKSTPEAGAEAASALFDHLQPPTAIFVGNDNMALGAMDAARKRGLGIPHDVSIVGFDDIALSANSFISLTTVDSMAGLLGEEAGSLLLQRIAAGETPPYSDLRSIVHEPSLHVRGTTGPPAG